MKTLMKRSIILLVTMALWSCAPLYDQFTFDETGKTKQAAMSLIEKSDTPFTENVDDITALKTQLEKMETYEKGKKKNEITVKMWELLGSDDHLVGSYLKLWEEKETLNTAFTEEASPQIEKAFDLMLLYEEKKDKKRKNALTDFINNL